MVSGSKFYIYGGGRWREVDISGGHVEGWGRARFLYPRRGKIQMANTRAVLAALRDHADGQNSAVKDGAHLPHKKIEKMKTKDKKEHEAACDNSHCCHNSNASNPSKINQQAIPKISTGTQYVAKADAGIQTSQTLTFPDNFNSKKLRKRRRETTSSDEKIPTKITTTATIHTDSPKQKVPSLKLEKADSAKYNIYKRRRSKSSDSVVWVVLPKNKGNNESQDSSKKTKYLQPKSKLHPTNNRQESIQTIDTPGQSQKTMQISKDNTATKLSDNARQRSATRLDEPDIITLSKSNFKPQTSKKTKPARQDQCKELIIDEKDIELLRTYLMNHHTNFDLLKFDQDNEYKKDFFFKINPLVNVERCPKIAWMLRRESQSEISLRDFASQLGLRSVSEKSVPKRYRMRKRNTEDKASISDTDKENSELHQKKGIKIFDKSMKEGRKNYLVKDKMSKIDSVTDLDQEEYHKKYKRSGTLFKESNRKDQDTEIQRSRPHKTSSRNLDLTLTTSEEETTIVLSKDTKRSKNESQNLVNKGRNIDLTNSSEENSEVEDEIKEKLSKQPNRKGQIHKIANLSLTSTSSEDETPMLSKESRSQNKIKNNVIKGKHSYFTDSDEENFEIEDLKSSKGSHRRGHNKDNNKKPTNKRKYKDLTDSTDETSEEEAPKLPTKTHRKGQNNSSINKPKNIVSKDSDEDIFEVEPPKLAKEKNRKGQTNKIRTIDHSNLNEDNSKVNASKSAIPNGIVRNKDKINKNENKIKGLTDLNKNRIEDHKQSKEANRRGLNKVDKSQNEKKTRIIDPTDSSEEENPKLSKEKNKEDSKRSRENKKVQDKDNTTKKTADTKELSNDEDDIFVQKDASKNISHGSKSGAVKTKNAISKRPLSSIRPYSNLEDHAIVTWVSTGGRASCVNGNRLWMELQKDYNRISGQSRTWHSLRNRYLRYILPSLGSMALPISHVGRLRAAAATGEIRSRKRLIANRRNSIFTLPSRGALSRRHVRSRSSEHASASDSDPRPPPSKRHKHDHTRDRRKEKSPSPKRSLRSSLTSSPLKSNHSPRYSEITRRFAATHQQDDSTPIVSPTPKESAPKSAEKYSSARNSSAIDSWMIKESSATNPSSLRKSLRIKESPAVTDTVKKSERERTRTKLFNPGSEL